MPRADGDSSVLLGLAPAIAVAPVANPMAIAAAIVLQSRDVDPLNNMIDPSKGHKDFPSDNGRTGNAIFKAKRSYLGLPWIFLGLSAKPFKIGLILTRSRRARR